MRRKIAPIIIVALVLVYTFLMLLGIMQSPIPRFSSLEFYFVALVVLLVSYFVVALIVTLIKRLKEIDKEDKDDLSKY